MKFTRRKTYEVMSDGRTVWVNHHGGYNLGRFSDRGVDIHRDFFDQTDPGNECLDCTHGETTLEHWERFKAGMLRFHGVEVTDKHMPKFLKVDSLSADAGSDSI